jgi:hypothetical protein
MPVKYGRLHSIIAEGGSALLRHALHSALHVAAFLAQTILD